VNGKYHKFIRPLRDGRYRLDVPAGKSPTGSRIRERFDTVALANGRAKELFIERENVAIAVSNITPAQALDATKALALLADHHPEVTLTDAAKLYLANAARMGASVSFKTALASFLAAKEGRRSPLTLNHYKWFSDSMEPLHERLVAAIDLKDVEGVLAAKPDGTYDAFRRYGRAVFNFAIARRWAVENPFARLEKRPGRKGEVITLPAAKLQKLLDTALEGYLELVPYYVFTFLCGIRADVAEGEITRLDWADIDWAKREILVRAEVSKTKRRRRFVPISENGMARLEAYRQRGGLTSGRVVPFSAHVLRKWCRGCRVDAGFRRGTVAPGKVWIQALGRHSFCSAWLAKHQDAHQLVLISGHDSESTMWEHYHRGMTQEEAEAYWSVRPPKACQSSKVVSFAVEA
jgi:integrase